MDGRWDRGATGTVTLQESCSNTHLSAHTRVSVTNTSQSFTQEVAGKGELWTTYLKAKCNDKIKTFSWFVNTVILHLDL